MVSSFSLSFLIEFTGEIEYIAFDTSITDVTLNGKSADIADIINDNITRVTFFDIIDKDNLNFSLAKNINDEVCINNVVIRFKDKPVFYYIDKKIDENGVTEDDKDFITRNILDKNIYNNNIS